MPPVPLSPAHRVAFVLPNIPDVHYFYPFAGPPCGCIDSVVRLRFSHWRRSEFLTLFTVYR